MISQDSQNSCSLNYSFSPKEIALLAKFFREKETELPKGLENFHKALENSIYECLSIEEVKRFYS